jgi:Flp pilus assembly protein TadD
MNSWNRIGLIAALGASLALAGCSDLTGDLGLGAGQKSQKAGASSHERGRQQFLAGNYGLAAKHFQQAVTRQDASVESLNGLAASYDKMGRFDLAERYYRRALAVEPGSGQTLNNLGYSYLLQGKYDLALAHLRDAQVIDPQNPVIQANRTYAQASLNASLAAGGAPAEPSAAAPQQAAVATSVKLKVSRTSANVQTLTLNPEPESEPSLDAVASEFGALRAQSTNPSALAETALEAASEGAEEGAIQIALLTPAGVPADDAGELSALADFDFLAAPGPGYAADLAGALVEVSNGAGRDKMAARMRGYLKTRGVEVGWLSNANHFHHGRTTIYYQEAWRPQAEALATLLPGEIALAPAKQQAAQLKLQLGADLLGFDSGLHVDQLKQQRLSHAVEE